MDEESRYNYVSGQLPDALRHLQEENVRLKALLDANGIPWEESVPSEENSSEIPSTSTVQRSAMEKVALFGQLFRGRRDVYPIRWESAKGMSGYSPACSNEWRKGICNKPGIKCGDCEQRLLLPVTENVLYRHLTGKHTIGVYPMLPDETCYFIATDFDDEGWHEDSSAFIQSCRELNIPASLEISRSGNGAHVWNHGACHAYLLAWNITAVCRSSAP